MGHPSLPKLTALAHPCPTSGGASGAGGLRWVVVQVLQLPLLHFSYCGPLSDSSFAAVKVELYSTYSRQIHATLIAPAAGGCRAQDTPSETRLAGLCGPVGSCLFSRVEPTRPQTIGLPVVFPPHLPRELTSIQTVHLVSYTCTNKVLGPHRDLPLIAKRKYQTKRKQAEVSLSACQPWRDHLSSLLECLENQTCRHCGPLHH